MFSLFEGRLLMSPVPFLCFRSSEQVTAPCFTHFPSFRLSVSNNALYNVSAACQLGENSFPSVFFCTLRTGMIRSTAPSCRPTSRNCWSCCWSRSSSRPRPFPPAAAWCPTKPSAPLAFSSKGPWPSPGRSIPCTSSRCGRPARHRAATQRSPKPSRSPSWRAGCGLA